MIELRAASIGYGQRPAVREVSMVIERHAVLALVGPNGAGKTTLVRGILGLAPVLAGEIRLFGTPATRFRQRYRIGYVPQRHTIGGAIPATVAEVVASGRLPRKGWWARMTAADRAAIDAAIDSVGLTVQRRSPIGSLSGGQQRRALIARALAAEPEVLVMDEPTAGVDAASQQQLTGTLARLVERGLTMVVVTHDVRPLLPILTRVAVLRDGALVRQARLADGQLDGAPLAEPELAALLTGPEAGLDPGHDPEHAAPGEPPEAGTAAPTGWLREPRVGG